MTKLEPSAAAAEGSNNDDMPRVDDTFDFTKEEEQVLKMWTEKDAFRTQLKLSSNRKIF